MTNGPNSSSHWLSDSCDMDFESEEGANGIFYSEEVEVTAHGGQALML
jgi:hypothetical protein